MRVAFFTAGTRGAGHLARGLAIGRALSRAGFAGEYRMFGPEPPFTPFVPAAWTTIEVDEAELATRTTARASSIGRALEDFAPDLLMVDMFWAPLRHLLPLRGCESWLLLRSFPPAWLVGPPGFPFEPLQFDRIVAIEPLAHAALTHTIDPVVMVNPDEQRPKGALRQRLGVPDGKRLVAIAHAGLPGEHRVLAVSPGPDDVLVTFDLFETNALFPVAEWLRDCDALHCAAGYNAFWEASWLGYARRTTFTPFVRRNDDQHWRVQRGARYRMGANGADTLARWLMDG